MTNLKIALSTLTGIATPLFIFWLSGGEFQRGLSLGLTAALSVPFGILAFAAAYMQFVTNTKGGK